MGLFDAVGSVIGSMFQFGSNNATNKMNYKIAQENLGFQRENLDYQKALQKQIFEREDTAYQRTVNDMRFAGLNPVSMQGTNSAGEAVQTEPLHNDFQFQNAFNGVMDVLNTVSNISNNKSLTDAQKGLLDQQAENQRIKNLFEADLLSKTISGLNYDNLGKRFRNEMDYVNLLNLQDERDFNTMYGLTGNMPEVVKLAGLLGGERIFRRDFSKYERSDDDFGLTFPKNTQSSAEYFLDNQKLAGSIRENQIINGLLSLIPMGIGNLFKR